MKKFCIDDSQLTRLMTDTAKLAKGRHDDICATVEDLYRSHVPKELTISKAKKTRREKDPEEIIVDSLLSRIGRKINAKLDDLI